MKEENKSLKKLSGFKVQLEHANSIQDRIQFLVDCNGNPNSFAKLVGLSVSGLKRYLSGGEPTATKIIQIADKSGVNPEWLLTGKGAIFNSDETGKVSNDRAIAIISGDHEIFEHIDSSAKYTVENISSRYAQLKNALDGYAEITKEFLSSSNLMNSKEFDDEHFSLILSDLKSSFAEEYALIPGYRVQVSAGHGALNCDDKEPVRYLAFRRKWLKYRGFEEHELAIVWAKGDSMEPTIHSNDTLVVHLGRNSPADGHIYIFRNGDELFVKRYQNAFGSWRLISDNPVYDKLDIPKLEQHQFEVVGQVVHIAKDIGD